MNASMLMGQSVLQIINAVQKYDNDEDSDLVSGEEDSSREDDSIQTSEIGQSIDAIYPGYVLAKSDEIKSESEQARNSPASLTKSRSVLRSEIQDAVGEQYQSEEEETQEESYMHSSWEGFKEKTMVEKLQTIFELQNPEELKGEWACYLVRSVLLQGWLYLTERHICFYASLPKNQETTQKAGFLSKRKKAASIYTRFWFQLQNDVLSWYESSTDVYYPLGAIDLKYVLELKRSSKREHGFKITTPNRTFHLTADTKQSLLEWISILQKAIFRSKNSGDVVKIVLPFENIIDIEKTNPLEFAEYVRIRVVEEESYAMDEYYFAYFQNTDKTFDTIKSYWQDAQPVHPTPSKQDSPKPLLSSIMDTTHRTSHSETASPTQQSSTITLRGLSGSSLVPSFPGIKDFIPGMKKLNTHTEHEKESSSSPHHLTPKETKRSSAHNLFVRDSTHSSVQSAPSIPHIHRTTYPDVGEEGTSSGSDNDGDKPMFTWLNEKRRSGMKVVYDRVTEIWNPSTIGSSDIEDAGEASERQREITEAEGRKKTEQFQKTFALNEQEKLVAMYHVSLLKTLPYYGKLFISTHYLCFKSKVLGSKFKFIIPLTDIASIQKLKSVGYFFHGLSVVTLNQEEVFLEFSSIQARNDCFAMLFLQNHHIAPKATMPTDRDKKRIEALFMDEEHFDKLEHVPLPMSGELPPLLSKEPAELTYPPPANPLHITCLTIGTRGDVQPYIALCKGLMKEGHTCRIATHEEYRDWIIGHGIQFEPIGGDPGELMRICVENGMFTVGFLREGVSKFRGWFEDLMATAWKAVQGTEVLIESPSAMVGIHLAEKLDIAYYRAFPMPWTRTRSFPHPFATPDSPKGRVYNDMTYVMIDHVLWRGTSNQINRFRREALNLPSTSLEKLETNKVPFLYCFSPSVIPPPLDWMDWIHTVGYWFLDNPDHDWKPPRSLLDFINKSDNRPLVYIGFGSIIVPDPDEMTRTIVEAVQKSNVRAILSKGWSARLQDQQKSDKGHHTTEELLEKNTDIVYNVKSIPHDWLFTKVRGVVHHGGAGTTAAGLRAGVATIIKPYFGDQFFWGDRLEEMGVGICVKKLTVEKLANALQRIATDDQMQIRAKQIGEKIRGEDGVTTAIQCIYRDLDLAKNRLKKNVENPINLKFQDVSGPGEDVDWTLVDRGDSNSGSGSIVSDYDHLSEKPVIVPTLSSVPSASTTSERSSTSQPH